MISGVCSGLGEYLRVDPTIVRLVFIVFLIVTGLLPGALIYLIAAIIIPEEK